MKLNRSILVSLLVTILIVGCSGSGNFSYPAVEMTAPERDDLRASLARLDAAIAKSTPSIYSQLRQGAGDEEIAQLRLALGGAVNQPLEEWFSWRNGATSYAVALLPLGYPLSIEEALSKLEESRTIPFSPSTRLNSLKILDDFGGDGYFVDLRSQTPYVFYEMLEDPGPGYVGTLAEFLNFLASCFEKEIFFADENGAFSFDENSFYVLEGHYLKSASKP